MFRNVLALPKETDVVVIGAGPSGSRSAERLAALGHRVVLLERDQEVGLPVHCTGIVSCDCFERYELPDDLIIRSISSFVLRSPSGRGVNVRRSSTQAYVLDRIGLDRMLAQRAVDAGASLFTSAGVQDIRWHDGEVLVTGIAGEFQFELSAKVAVLATGFGSQLACAVGLTGTQSVVSGSQAIVESHGVEELEVLTGAMLGHGGFGWIVPWRPRQALVGLLTRKHTATYLRSLITTLQHQGRIGSVAEMYRTRAIPIGLPDQALVDGIVGVGDVVSQAKPTSGGGIHYGLMGADIAAETIHQALLAGDCSAQGLAPYEKGWRVLLEKELLQGARLRGLLEQLPDSVIDHMHRLLSIPGFSRLLMAPSFDWHSGPLTKLLNRLHRVEPASISS